MIVKQQKPIEFINDCGCLVDLQQLEKAIVWYTDRPVSRLKRIFLHGHYPAVAIYKEKIHVHRLLMMYWEQRKLPSEEYVHHKNENKLCAERWNLEIMLVSKHQSHHHKGKQLSTAHKERISEANRTRKVKYKKRIDLPVSEIVNLYKQGETISSLARRFSVDRWTIKNRLYESPHLLDKTI